MVTTVLESELKYLKRPKFGSLFEPFSSFHNISLHLGAQIDSSNLG